MSANETVIVSACRTAVGSLSGALSTVPAQELGATVIREALQRAGVPAEDVDEVILGHVLQGGTGQHPARRAALLAGLPLDVSAFAINKVCGSGLFSVCLADQAIRAGSASVVQLRYPDFVAINWIDADGVIRQVNPVAGNASALGKDLTQHPLAGP